MPLHRKSSAVSALCARGVSAAICGMILAACTVTTEGEGSTKPPEVKLTIGATPSESATAGVVPAVVGKDHQFAQDTMQAAGFYRLREQDATGQNRLLINDRNWIVVAQHPRAGSRVAVSTTITLRSKKKTDP
jgi:beta-lactam-binding protein with PASTA domain